MEPIESIGQVRQKAEQSVAAEKLAQRESVAAPFTNAIMAAIRRQPNDSTWDVTVNNAYGIKRISSFLEEQFAAAGYRFPALLRDIALSPAFSQVVPPAPAAQTANAGIE